MKLQDFVETAPTVSLSKGQIYPCIMMDEVNPGARYVHGKEAKVYTGGGTRFQSGDTLFARITPCLENGKIAQYSGLSGKNAFGSTEFIIFRTRDGISDPGFVYYLAKTDIIRKPAEKSMFGASGRQRADINVIKGIYIPAHSLPAQRKVAAILSAYDDLIENNTRRIKILEEMAQSIYREWFVHFRFPGHEGMRMVDSGTELGIVPEGWGVTKLADVCNSIEDGDWIETKDQGGNEYRLLQISNIGLGEFRETENFRYITQETFERLRCNEVKPGDILVARMPDPIGRAWLVTRMPWRMVTAVDVAIIRINPSMVSSLYCVSHLNSPSILELAKTIATGTTRPRITRRNLSTVPIIVPPFSLIHQYDNAVDPLHLFANTLRKQSDSLNVTRDMLLPKLISGELDVSELEIRVS